jgi:hypothetical protein
MRFAHPGDLVVAGPDLVRDRRDGPRLKQECPDPAGFQATIQVGVGGRPEPLPAGGEYRGRAQCLGHESVMERPMQGQQVARAVPKMMKEASLGDASLFDHPVNTHTSDPSGFREAQASLDHGVPGMLRPLASGGHNGSVSRKIIAV